MLISAPFSALEYWQLYNINTFYLLFQVSDKFYSRSITSAISTPNHHPHLTLRRVLSLLLVPLFFLLHTTHNIIQANYKQLGLEVTRLLVSEFRNSTLTLLRLFDQYLRR